jgi:integrase
MAAKKPKKQSLGPYHAEPHRPPIKSSPHWAWRIYFFEDGSRVAVSMPDGSKASGRFDAKEAKRRLTELFRFNPAPTTAKISTGVQTVGDLRERYLDARGSDPELKASTLKAYEAAMRWLGEVGVLSWPIGRLADVAAMRTLRDRLIARNLGDRTIEQVFRILRMAVKFGTEEGWHGPLTVPTNKAIGVTKIKARNRRPKVTPPAETVMAVTAAVGTETDLGCVIHLLAVTGARIGEIIGLQNHCIDIERGSCTRR